MLRGREGVRSYGRKCASEIRPYKRTRVKLSLGAKSLVFFGLSVVFLILLTLFEAGLSGLSLFSEKLISVLLLVFPSAVGAVLGMLSMIRKEPKPWKGMFGTVLNALFALFHIFVISFAG